MSKCKICNSKFEDKTKNKNRLYCSRECKNKAYRKGYTYISKICIICKKEFQVKTTQKYAKCCSQKCSEINWRSNNKEYVKQKKKEYRLSNLDTLLPYNRIKSKERRENNPLELPKYRKSNLKYSTEFLEENICPKCNLRGRKYVQTTFNMKTKHKGLRLVFIHKPHKTKIKKCYLGQCDENGDIVINYLK